MPLKIKFNQKVKRLNQIPTNFQELQEIFITAFQIP